MPFHGELSPSWYYFITLRAQKIGNGYLKPLTEFDEYEFKFAVNRVLVDSESCTFELKNGMKFKEIF